MTLMILKMIGCLALLMFGMKTMSEGLQKLTGGHLRAVLGTMTKHRIGGLLTGTFVTASVQSSTATTVLTVSFVNAGVDHVHIRVPVQHELGGVALLRPRHHPFLHQEEFDQEYRRIRVRFRVHVPRPYHAA